jgi:hypothetical protein
MNSPIFSYLSINFDSEGERNYILGLKDQFEFARDTGSYHLALFAYHLLFICYLYQTLYKIKIWMPEKHHIAMVYLEKERREKFRNALNPTDFAHNQNKESSFFEFLNIFCDCEKLVSRCKNLIKYRNNRLGHVNYFIVSEEEFNKKIEEYDQVACEVQELTHIELSKIFDEYFKNTDKRINPTKDDLELNLILLNKLSDKDLECLSAECLVKPNKFKNKIKEILENDFGIITKLV